MSGLLERIQKALGLRSVPEDVGALWAKARTEREALDLLEQACRRDEERVARCFADLDALGAKEREVLEQGRAESSDARRLFLARLLRDVRAKAQEIRSRVEQVYDKRLRVYREHLQSLRTIVELAAEPLPASGAMEDAAIKARLGMEGLERSLATAEGIAGSAQARPVTEEERAILDEFAAPAGRSVLPAADEARRLESPATPAAEPLPEERDRERRRERE